LKLDALILADATSTPPGGKFYVHGGGFSRFEVGALPASIPVGVLARLRIEKGDAIEGHAFRFALIGPLGIPNVDPIEYEVGSAGRTHDLVEGEEEFLHLSIQIPGIAVRDGLYHVEFRIDGRLVRKVPMPVVVNEALKPEEREEAPLSAKRKPKDGRPKPGPSSGTDARPKRKRR